MKNKMKRFALSHTILILMIWNIPFYTQNNGLDTASSYFNSRIYEIGNQINYSFDDANRLYGGITDFDNADLIYSAAFLIGTAASFSLDKDLKNLSARNQNSKTKSITDIGEKYGNGIYSVILSAGLFSTGLITNNKEVTNTGRILAEALAVSGLTVQLIKIVSGRSRPYLNEGNFKFNWFETNNDYNSFPSGHTVVAFTTSSVLAASIKNVYASIALYSLAGLTAYQRIYSNNHWFSDTVLAAIIGTVVGNALVRINDDRFDQDENVSRIRISPGFNSFGPQLIFLLKL